MTKTPNLNRLKDLLENYYQSDISIDPNEAQAIEFELSFEYNALDQPQLVPLALSPGDPSGLTLEIADLQEMYTFQLQPLTLNPRGLPEIQIYEL